MYIHILALLTCTHLLLFLHAPLSWNGLEVVNHSLIKWTSQEQRSRHTSTTSVTILKMIVCVCVCMSQLPSMLLFQPLVPDTSIPRNSSSKSHLLNTIKALFTLLVQDFTTRISISFYFRSRSFTKPPKVFESMWRKVASRAKDKWEMVELELDDAQQVARPVDPSKS